MIKEAIGILVDGCSLSLEQAASTMEEIMDGIATPAQLGAFITALRIKGETAEEIAGLASVMRARAIPVNIPGPVLDVVGTGGDGLNTFNISTAAAFVAAGAGIHVAKHGNRAASSTCGSADVLENLGVKIDLNARQVQQCIDTVGIGFMFAPMFHPAMKYAFAPRKEIGIRTVFNILGPLTNPAGAQYQVLGVPNIDLAEKMVTALIHLESKHALVVHGLIGMDELSITGNSCFWEIKNGELTAYRKTIAPGDFGLQEAPLKTIQGGSPEENARYLRHILQGEKSAKRDVVVLNAAAAMLAGDKVENLNEGVSLAQKVIDGGLALTKLDQLISFTRNLQESNGDTR